VNNLYQSFTYIILCVRDKPILTMFEWIKKNVMDNVPNYGKKKNKVLDMRAISCQDQEKRLDNKI